jgi:hypothetical protein
MSVMGNFDIEQPEINKHTLQLINKKVLESDTGLLLGGPSCVGKTHFSFYLKRQDGFVGVKYMPKLKAKHLFESKNADEYYKVPNSEGYTNKGKVVIVLGIPFTVFLARCTLRKKFSGFIKKPNAAEIFKERYSVNMLPKLEEYNIPHILLDARNDYPVLDKLSFIEMLST